MPEKCRMTDKETNRIADKMADFMLLMGYNADLQVMIAKELNRHIWMSSENLSRSQCRELLYLLCTADNATLLSFTASLGRLLWRSYLRVKRRTLKKKILDKIKEREQVRKKRRGGRKYSLVVVLGKGRRNWALYREKTDMRLVRCKIGFITRSRLVHKVARCRKRRENVQFGSRVYRLGLAMGFLSFRNVCVTSEWEFSAVCLVQQVFGFWRSIAIGGDLDCSFVVVAQKIGLNVVSSEHLDRLQSCLRCSSTNRYQGYWGD